MPTFSIARRTAIQFVVITLAIVFTPTRPVTSQETPNGTATTPGIRSYDIASDDYQDHDIDSQPPLDTSALGGVPNPTVTQLREMD